MQTALIRANNKLLLEVVAVNLNCIAVFNDKYRGFQDYIT